jgi:hypothetical protein
VADVELERALLDLGLEDLIPLPEAVDAVEVRDAMGGDPSWLLVAQALRALLVAGKVRVYRGRWDDDEPVALDDHDALALLEHRGWYSWKDEDGQYTQERVSYVNVDNLADA